MHQGVARSGPKNGKKLADQPYKRAGHVEVIGYENTFCKDFTSRGGSRTRGLFRLAFHPLALLPKPLDHPVWSVDWEEAVKLWPRELPYILAVVQEGGATCCQVDGLGVMAQEGTQTSRDDNQGGGQGRDGIGQARLPKDKGTSHGAFRGKCLTSALRDSVQGPCRAVERSPEKKQQNLTSCHLSPPSTSCPEKPSRPVGFRRSLRKPSNALPTPFNAHSTAKPQPSSTQNPLDSQPPKQPASPKSSQPRPRLQHPSKKRRPRGKDNVKPTFDSHWQHGIWPPLVGPKRDNVPRCN